MTSLGLALGLTSAVFSVIDAYRHPRSAFRDPDRLYSFYIGGEGAAGNVTNADRLAAVRARLRSSDSVAYRA